MIEIPSSVGGTTRIGITRAHLEEDTGKTGHELPGGHPYEGSLVDYNERVHRFSRSSRNPISRRPSCVTFGRELRNICRFLGVTEGIMQKGHMRFEPNINLELTLDDGRTVATPVVEVKNLNSFRAVLGAIQHESERQVEAWKADGLEMGPGMKSTRGWTTRSWSRFSSVTRKMPTTIGISPIPICCRSSSMKRGNSVWADRSRSFR